MGNTYQIIEYGSFVADKDIAGYTSLPQHTFNALESFILSNRSKDSDAVELLGISAKKRIGKVITAKNYVGVITMTDGTTIEILPKIHSEQCDINSAKKLLIDMLKTITSAPYKSIQSTNVNIDKLSIFELFIRMFVDETLLIVKRGLRSGYQTVQNNEPMLKGKLMVAEHIKRNIAHKEFSYIEYDEFNTNRPENKIIKSTLLYLYKRSHSTRNRVDIKNLLNSFAMVDESTDVKGDFERYTPERNNRDYTTALEWCRVFLLGKSFTVFSGSEIAFALLFPMEVLFENYVAYWIRRMVDSSKYSVSVQDKSFYLFDNPRKFVIKPDIVLKNNKDGSIYVIDTKWKLLSSSSPNYGISQADMYQMYAYQKKYKAKSVTLLYPQTDELTDSASLSFISMDGATVFARFVNLLEISTSIKGIVFEVVNY